MILPVPYPCIPQLTYGLPNMQFYKIQITDKFNVLISLTQELYEAAADLVTGSVDFRHTWVNMSDVYVGDDEYGPVSGLGFLFSDKYLVLYINI